VEQRYALARYCAKYLELLTRLAAGKISPQPD
jgi:hypothetical protein